MTIFILKLLALYVLVSVAAGLMLGAVMRWCLHDDPPVERYPLPSGSIRDRTS